MSLVMHFSWSGHVFLSLQVHAWVYDLALWLAFSSYACVVLRNYILDIVHAAITDPDCVSVKNLVYSLWSGGKCLSIRHRKLRAVCFDVFAEWRVKPNDIAMSVSACFFVVLASCNLVCGRNCCALMHFGK